MYTHLILDPATMLNISQWLSTQKGLQFNQQDLSCIETLMLKIIDGKCKMSADDKWVIRHLYETQKLDVTAYGKPEVTRAIQHALSLVSDAQSELPEGLKLEIYEHRLLAETQISRPVMKQFKAGIRKAGIYDCLPEDLRETAHEDS